MNTWAWISFALVTGFVVVSGLVVGSRSTAESNDYFLGGRTYGTWRSAIAAFASAESGFVFLGLVGMAYTGGVVTLWLLIGVVYAYLGTWLFMGPRVNRIVTERGVLTVPQLLAAFSGERSKAVLLYGSLVLIAAMLMYVAVQFHAIGLALVVSADVPMIVGLCLGAALVVGYSAIGGLRAVSHTDLFQGILMLGSLTMLGIVLLGELRSAAGGGLLQSMEALSPALTHPFGGAEGWAAFKLAFYYSIVGLGLTGAPHFLRKFMAAGPQTSFPRAGWISMISCFILFSLAIFIGFAGRVLFDGIGDPETLLPFLSKELFAGARGIAGGLLIASLFGAIASTGDSQLLEASASVTGDWERFSRRPRFASRPRIIMLVLGVLALFFALVGDESIFERTLTAWAILGSTFGPQLLLVLGGYRTTGAGILAGMVTGSATVVLWEFVLPCLHDFYSLAPGFLLAAVVNMIVSRLTGGDNRLP